MNNSKTYIEDSTLIRTGGNGHAFGRSDLEPRSHATKFAMIEPSGKLEPFPGWEDPPCRAATSASILTSTSNGDVKHHVLIDAGPGIGDSLANSLLTGLENIEAIVNSHLHPDHNRSLNQICEGVRRARQLQGKSFVKIPFLTTLATYTWLRERGGLAYELDKFLEFVELVPERKYRVQSSPPIDIVGIEVAHGRVKGAVILTAEIGEAQKRAVFCWDIDRPDRQRPSDGMSNLDAIRANASMLRNAELLYMAANTYAADEGTGHTSFLNALKYVEEIAAKRIFFVHMSGYEDGPGNPGFGLSDSQWDTLIKKHLPTAGIALQGMITPL